MVLKDKLINYFSKNIKELFFKVDSTYFEDIDEIRIRLNKGIIFRKYNKEYFLLKNGDVSAIYDKEKIYLPCKDDIDKTLQTMSDYSIYALEQEIKNGFLTLSGGFRVGLVGKVITEDDKIKSIRNISSLNIRIAREVRECSKPILKYIMQDEVKSTMIVSSPNCGKTTLLRDIVKNISDMGQNVGLVDERSEIAGSYMGQIQLDVGLRTDVLDRCKKSEGMLMLLRSMSPNVIAVDEIGQEQDIEAIERIANSGVKLVCTVHATDIEDVKNKDNINNILNKKVFERFVVLKRKNDKPIVDKIYNQKFEIIYDGDSLCI